jgi:hypothetical protein
MFLREQDRAPHRTLDTPRLSDRKFGAIHRISGNSRKTSEWHRISGRTAHEAPTIARRRNPARALEGAADGSRARTRTSTMDPVTQLAPREVIHRMTQRRRVMSGIDCLSVRTSMSFSRVRADRQSMPQTVTAP